MATLRTYLLLSAIFASALLFGCAGGSGKGGACSTQSQCYDWQACNATRGICITAQGYCAADADCNDTLLRCDTNSTHTCAYKSGRCRSDANCESWQVCDSGNSCQPKPGFCTQDSQCSKSWQMCNTTRHKCSAKPGFCDNDYDCHGWESCDTASNKCSPLSGRCNSDSDCQPWEKCYTTGYSGLFTIPQSTCGPKDIGVTCSSDIHCDTDWQKCDSASKRCVPKQGYCEMDNECSSWEYCNTNNHRCKAKPDMCGADADCGSWQYCPSDHLCTAKAGYCTVDKDCASGMVCDETGHICQ